MEELLHTIVIGRHYKHKNNIATDEGYKEAEENAEAIKDQVPQNDNVVRSNLLGSNEARTQGLAAAIANTLQTRINSFQVKEYLNLKPENSRVKDILDKLNEFYDQDPDIIAGKGYSDTFVDKFQHNLLKGADFNRFASFYVRKLAAALGAIKRKPDDKNMTIMGIHGGYFLESVLYGIRGENLPVKWKGQIRMGENLVMKISRKEVDGATPEDEKVKKVFLTIKYRGEERTVSEDDIQEAIKKLNNPGA